MNAVITYPAAQTVHYVAEYEEISVGAVSTALDQGKAGRCQRAVIKTDGDGFLRYLLTGGDPTTLVGKLIFSGEQIELSHEDALRWRAIRVGADNLILRVDYLQNKPF